LVTSGANDNTARSWDIATGMSLAPPMQCESGSLTLLMGHRSGYFAYGMDANFEAVLWDPHTGEALTPLLEHSQRTSALAFSPDERRLAVGCWDRTVRVWDLPPSEEALPDWFLRFAEAHAGMRLDLAGLPSSISTEELQARRAEVLAMPDDAGPVARWAKWIASEPEKARGRSPWALQQQ
jgi:WD40 repeat protein